MDFIKTQDPHFTLRFAAAEDTPLILGFIKQLAAYENMSDQVEATEDTLKQSLFDQKSAEVLIGEYDGEAVAFALFFHNFSTFIGRPGIYLEDLFVLPKIRNKGLGKILLAFLAHLAVDRNCGRLEWSCLDWNAPSVAFYKSLGATPMDEWTVYRLSGTTLSNMAERF